MSDKGLLKRCGKGKSYLNEVISDSVRPSGLRIRRAEAWTYPTPRWWCSESQRKPETFFQRLSHRASEYEGLRPLVIWNWCLILRERGTSAWKTLRPGTTPRHGKGQPEGPAVTGKARKPWVAEPDLVSEETAGQNNSNLTSWAASAANGEWELLLANSSHYCFYIIPPFYTPAPKLSVCILHDIIKGFFMRQLVLIWLFRVSLFWG